MKRGILLLLTALFIFSSTECKQLLKLPLLWEHFFEHHRENPEINAFQFFLHHYVCQDDHADEQDQKLPFKSGTQSIHQLLPYSVSHNDCALHLFSNEDEAPLNDAYQAPYSTAAHDLVWQPPKFS
jgi:hypothetical protein